MSTIAPLNSALAAPAAEGLAAARNDAKDAAALAAKGPKAAEAFRQFEAFVMQTFIEEMLPKNASAVFGSGTAGSVWKSMLAEKLAGQIAKSGGVGIAQRIAAGAGAGIHPVSSASPAALGAGAAGPPTSETAAGKAETSGDQL